MKTPKQISRVRGCNPGYKTKHVNSHAGAAFEERGRGMAPEQKGKQQSRGIASLALADRPREAVHPSSCSVSSSQG